jgi:hypothetical protein
MSLLDDSIKPQRLSHDKSGSLKSSSGTSEFPGTFEKQLDGFTRSTTTSSPWLIPWIPETR